jgi:hypothetical protein
MNDNWDKLLKVVLVGTLIYFVLHIGFALASSTPPTIQCWNNGFGTIQCIQI